MRKFILAAVFSLCSTFASAQAVSDCVKGGTVTDVSGNVLYCTGNGTAIQMAKTTDVSGGGIPAGLITMLLSGSCPSGWAEQTALNGVYLRGTVAANANVGQAGGSDTLTAAGAIAWPAGVPTFTGTVGVVPAETFTGSSATSSAVTAGTPAGTVTAPTFTGNALAAHAHELPFQISSTTATRQLAAAIFGTGTSRAATGASAAGSSNTTSAVVALSQSVTAGTPAGTNSIPTFTGSALATHSHTLTATGTNGTVNFTPVGTIAWPAAVPTLAGSAVTNRPAYLNVIFCAKQ